MTATATARAAHDIEVGDIEYLRHGEAPLLARLFEPRGTGPFPLLLDLHGGAWCTGDRLNDTSMCEALARAGIAVAALDFRMPPAGGYPASIADINYAVRWFKSRAATHDLRPGKIGLIGISSGGHQGMLVAMRPTDRRYGAIPLAAGGAAGSAPDARVGCVVLCWPVIDPLGRYRYAKELQAKGGKYPEAIDRVLPSHDRYWGTEAAMAEGTPATALEADEAVELPPVLCVQGTADMMHPRPQLDRFVAAYERRGGAIEVALYEGEAEGFIMRNTKRPAHGTAAMARIIDFVHARLG